MNGANAEWLTMDTTELIHVIQTLNTEDAFRPRFDAGQWRSFAQYLTPHALKSGESLVAQGERDRTVYFLGRGSLQVYVTGGPPGVARLGLLRPGAICGEPGLFADVPRMASVEAMGPCTVFALSLPRFEEMAVRTPAVALEVTRAAGAVMVQRARINLTRPMPSV